MTGSNCERLLLLLDEKRARVSPEIEPISSPRVFDCGATRPRGRNSGCVAGLFRTGVPPKVTHKGDRASADYRSGHNKEVRTMRGTSFRHTARRRFSIACVPYARTREFLAAG